MLKRHPLLLRNSLHSLTECQFRNACFAVGLFLLELGQTRIKVRVMLPNYDSETVGPALANIVRFMFFIFCGLVMVPEGCLIPPGHHWLPASSRPVVAAGLLRTYVRSKYSITGNRSTGQAASNISKLLTTHLQAVLSTVTGSYAYTL